MIKIHGAGRQEYYQRMQIPMKLQLLAEATHRRDKLLLQRSIEGAKEVGIDASYPEFVKAQRELEVVLMKNALRDALRMREPCEIRKMTRLINNNPLFMYHLQQDAIEADCYATQLERMMWFKRTVLHMDKKAMTEIRRYVKPSRMVHDVMKGVLLLMEVTEDESEDWRVCQHYLNPYGRDGMNKKVLDFDPSTVDPEIAARCREILESFDLDEVQEVSPALGAFYVWALGMVDAVETHHSSHAMRPATIKRQKAIFERSRSTHRLSISSSPSSKNFSH